jgi:hypothetical protein
MPAKNTNTTATPQPPPGMGIFVYKDKKYYVSLKYLENLDPEDIVDLIQGGRDPVDEDDEQEHPWLPNPRIPDDEYQ